MILTLLFLLLLPASPPDTLVLDASVVAAFRQPDKIIPAQAL